MNIDKYDRSRPPVVEIWKDAHDGYEISDKGRIRKKVDSGALNPTNAIHKIKSLVEDQKNNNMLWSAPTTPLEMLLQAELKKLHDAS